MQNLIVEAIIISFMIGLIIGGIVSLHIRR